MPNLLKKLLIFILINLSAFGIPSLIFLFTTHHV